jgi:endonuclease/exonuclease/phosphatase family metal-dependent hydrolase
MSSAPPIRVLGWNVENCGIKKAVPELVHLFAETIKAKTIDIAAFCEMRQGSAKKVGADLETKLSGWKSFASKGFVPGRLEEYLFVWNPARVAPVSIAGINVAGTSAEFRWEYHDTNKKKLGFHRTTKDRPPVMGEFKPKSGANVRVAIFHAPGPEDWRDPRDAMIEMAKVDDLKVAKTPTVLMGDFNVKSSANAKTGNFGSGAFGDLIKAKFQQLLDKDQLTSLRIRKTVPTSVAACLCQPYDQIFAFTEKNATYSYADAKVENLIEDAWEHAQDSTKPKQIHDALLALLKTKQSSVTKIGTVAEAFSAYRRQVSDHLPVSVSITC